MKKNILFALPLSVLVFACTQQPPGKKTECVVPHVPDQCTSSQQKVTVTVNSANLKVAPPNVCADKGTPVEFNIKPPNTDVIVVTVPKKKADTWMTGINHPTPAGFKVTVPDSASSGDEFNYYIVATNGKCYDPKITVD
jgi:hypothetical protein